MLPAAFMVTTTTLAAMACSPAAYDEDQAQRESNIVGANTKSTLRGSNCATGNGDGTKCKKDGEDLWCANRYATWVCCGHSSSSSGEDDGACLNDGKFETEDGQRITVKQWSDAKKAAADKRARDEEAWKNKPNPRRGRNCARGNQDGTFCNQEGGESLSCSNYFRTWVCCRSTIGVGIASEADCLNDDGEYEEEDGSMTTLPLDL